MTEKKQETLRDRLERVWSKRWPDPETKTELTADGKEVRTPGLDEFMGNLERTSELPHPRSGQNGGDS